MSVESGSAPVSLRPRGTSAVSLHERFSRVLVEQQTRTEVATFDPVLLQHGRMAAQPPVVLLMKTSPLSMLRQQAPRRAQHHHLTRRRRSVWTRLGWPQVTCRLSTSRPRGFWSFMNKYRWRAWGPPTSWRAGSLRSRLGQLRPLRPASMSAQVSGRGPGRLTLKKGGATALKGRGCSRKEVPTKRQLDAELDQYMSLSRRRLDQQLDQYMSMSRSRLDAELDEYMAMAGQ